MVDGTVKGEWDASSLMTALKQAYDGYMAQLLGREEPYTEPFIIAVDIEVPELEEISGNFTFSYWFGIYPDNGQQPNRGLGFVKIDGKHSPDESFMQLLMSIALGTLQGEVMEQISNLRRDARKSDLAVVEHGVVRN